MVDSDYGPVIGLLLSGVTSLSLWTALAHAARWAAHTFF